MANERSLSDLIQNLQNGPHKAALLIGAGCSVSAGIPAGNGFVNVIQKRYPKAYERASEKTYALCMKELLEVQRKRLIEEKIQNAKINWGHVAIAQLIDAGHVDRVLTTNFDPLVVRACAMIQRFPAVYDFAASSDFHSSRVSDPSVFHLHGQGTGFKLLNTDDGMEQIRADLPQLIADTVRERTLVVVGYGGWDPVFDALVEHGAYEHGLYWVTYEHDAPPPHVEHKLTPKRGGVFYIRSRDADSFFQRLATGLDCFPPEYVKKPFTHFAETLQVLTEFQPAHDPNRDEERDSAETQSTGSARKSGTVDIMKPVRDNLAKAVETFEQGNSDLVQAAWALYSQEKYEQVVELFEAADVSDDDHGAYYAWGTALVERARLASDDHAPGFFDDACDKYQRAIEVKPDHHAALYNWGLALDDLARLASDDDAHAFFDDACDKYRRALDVKPDDHEALTNWGLALANRALLASGDDARAFFEDACDKFRRALDIQPNDHKALTNWGNALANRARFAHDDHTRALFDDAYNKFRRALDVKPDDHKALYNWGLALFERARLTSGDDARALLLDACDKFRRAIDIKPDFHVALHNWGIALAERAQLASGDDARALFDDACDKYRRAVDIKPGKHEALNGWGNALGDLALLVDDSEAAPLFETAVTKYDDASKIRSNPSYLRNWGVTLNQWADHIADDDPEEAERLRAEAQEKFAEAERLRGEGEA